MTSDEADAEEAMQKGALLKAFVVGGIVLGAGLGVYRGMPELAGPAKLASGLRPAPEFTLKDANGKDVRLKDFSDSVVIVHFWAQWCAPCLPELPEIQGAAKKLPKDREGKNIVWLLVSQDESWEQAKKALDTAALTENVVAVLDPEAKLSAEFGTYQFPETYVLSREHGIAAKWIGPQEWSGDWGSRALAGIEALSSQKKTLAPGAEAAAGG